MFKKFFMRTQQDNKDTVYDRFEIGENCSFGSPASIMGERRDTIKIGNWVSILRYTELCGKTDLPVVIGDGTYINQRCLIRPNTTIGKNVSVGPDVMFMTDTHEIGPSQRRAGANLFPPIVVGDGCWIGARTTILGNVTIGHGTVIAAGSLVNKDCEANAVYAGVPARLIKRLEE